MSDLTALRLQGMHYSHIVHSVRQPLSEFQKSAAYVMLLDSDRWEGAQIDVQPQYCSDCTSCRFPFRGNLHPATYCRGPDEGLESLSYTVLTLCDSRAPGKERWRARYLEKGTGVFKQEWK